MKRFIMSSFSILSSFFLYLSLFSKHSLADDIYCIPGDSTSGIKTGLGCVSTSAGPGGFIESMLRISIGLGGGLALCLILYGVFIVTSSGGIPDKLKLGKEIITAAIVGLLFIILSVVLVNMIGINILGIPGLV